MSTGSPPPFVLPIGSTPPAAPVESPVGLRRLLICLVATVAAFDVCFWKVNAPGFSIALFSAFLGTIIFASRGAFCRTMPCLVILALLAGASAAAAVEAGVTNTFALLALLVALAGETHFEQVASHWGRWLSLIVAWVRAPGRVFWLSGALLRASVQKKGRPAVGLFTGLLLTLPALILALIFGILLAQGNAVFGSWTNSFFDTFWQELTKVLDPSRVLLWLFVAVTVLPLLCPVAVSAWWWSWTERLPRFPEIIPQRATVYSSMLILIVLNALFAVANFADIRFLWSGEKLPAGITYSGFVHNGVNTLTVTVILSACVLTAIFQQALAVASRRVLKVLGYLWIAQNLFLLLSVVRRLESYIEAYDMTVARLSVIIFLILVAAGYALLTLKIVKDKSLSWLIAGCVLAVFATFYITQFLDLAGWSANYNVARYEKDHTRNLDYWYLSQLGAPAWPALKRARELLPYDPSITDAINSARTAEEAFPQTQFDAKHWREFSLRAWWNRGALDQPKN